MLQQLVAALQRTCWCLAAGCMHTPSSVGKQQLNSRLAPPNTKLRLPGALLLRHAVLCPVCWVLCVQITGAVYWDAVGSIAVSALLGVVAIALIQRNRKWLIGKSMPKVGAGLACKGLVGQGPLPPPVLRVASRWCSSCCLCKPGNCFPLLPWPGVHGHEHLLAPGLALMLQLGALPPDTRFDCWVMPLLAVVG